MWIRSQDRRALLNVNQVLISPSVYGSIYYINDSLGEESNVLGVYSSKEKAKKVLDEIQEAIEDTFYYNIENLGCGSYALKKGCEIYEMPQDEDSEV